MKTIEQFISEKNLREDVSINEVMDLIKEYSTLVAEAIKEACAVQAEDYEGIDCLIRDDINIKNFIK